MWNFWLYIPQFLFFSFCFYQVWIQCFPTSKFLFLRMKSGGFVERDPLHNVVWRVGLIQTVSPNRFFFPFSFFGMSKLILDHLEKQTWNAIFSYQIKARRLRMRFQSGTQIRFQCEFCVSSKRDTTFTPEWWKRITKYTLLLQRTAQHLDSAVMNYFSHLHVGKPHHQSLSDWETQQPMQIGS